MKIRQAKFSGGVKFFEQGFLDRWGLERYNNIHEPCFFAGVNTDEDVKIINAHKGFKVCLLYTSPSPRDRS